jgi:multidrug efflux pump
MAFASGAGAGAQKAIGTAMLGGVISATFLVTLFAPLFYVLILQIFKGKEHHQQTPEGRPGSANSPKPQEIG